MHILRESLIRRPEDPFLPFSPVVEPAICQHACLVTTRISSRDLFAVPSYATQSSTILPFESRLNCGHTAESGRRFTQDPRCDSIVRPETESAQRTEGCSKLSGEDEQV